MQEVGAGPDSEPREPAGPREGSEAAAAAVRAVATAAGAGEEREPAHAEQPAGDRAAGAADLGAREESEPADDALAGERDAGHGPQEPRVRAAARGPGREVLRAGQVPAGARGGGEGGVERARQGQVGAAARETALPADGHGEDRAGDQIAHRH